MMRWLAPAFALLISAALAEEPATEQPVTLITRAGSRIHGMLSASQPITLRTARGPMPVDWTATARVVVSERVDPNSENAARIAIGDLSNDKYATRQAAQQKLRELGRAAIRPLRSAASATDPELARSALALLADLGEFTATDASGDELMLASGSRRRGDLSPEIVRLRSRWGVFNVPLNVVDSIEPLAPHALDGAKLAPPNGSISTLRTHTTPADSTLRAWSPPNADDGAFTWLQGLALTRFDAVVEIDANGQPVSRAVAAGEELSTLFARSGIVLETGAENAPPKAQETNLASATSGMGAEIPGGSLWVNFFRPQSYDAKKKEGVVAGAHIAGAFVQAAGAESVGIAAYDAGGRSLGVVFSEKLIDLPEGNAPIVAQLLAVRSAIPIARLRIFRVGGKKDEALLIDDLFTAGLVRTGSAPDLFSVGLRSGEKLCGTLAAADWHKGLALHAEFLSDKAPVIPIDTDDLVSLEPPSRRADVAPEEPLDPRKRRRMVLGNQHGVMLQNGEKFHACFVKLDENEALFLMSGEVEFRLPRELLRKIDLHPAYDPESGRALVSLGDGEKPGVDFRHRKKKAVAKDDAADPAEKDGDEPDDPLAADPKNDLLQQKQELKRMDDAKILAADILTGDLTVDDGGGEWTIGLQPVKSLVFPPNPEAAADQPGFFEWEIVMRDQSRFDVVPMALSLETLTVQLARGVVQLPFATFEILQRKAAKP
jgi:hypothetical protein